MTQKVRFREFYIVRRSTLCTRRPRANARACFPEPTTRQNRGVLSPIPIPGAGARCGDGRWGHPGTRLRCFANNAPLLEKVAPLGPCLVRLGRLGAVMAMRVNNAYVQNGAPPQMIFFRLPPLCSTVYPPPAVYLGCSAEFAVCRFVIHEMETGRTLQLVASSGCRGAIMILYRSSSLSSTEQTHFYSDEAARGCCRVCVAHRTTDDTRDKVAADRHSRACTCACFDRDAKCADLGSKFDFK